MTDQHGENPIEPMGEGSNPPEGSSTPPPAAPPPSQQPPAAPAAPASGATSYDMAAAKQTLQGANPFDLGIIGAGLIAFIASLLPFYTLSVSAAGIGSASDSVSAWHGFFGWFAVLVALVGAVAVALALFKVVALPMPVHQIAAGAFGLALLCMILALFVDPGGCGGAGAFGVNCDIGRGVGYWLALLAVLAGAGLSALQAKDSMTKTA